MALAPKPRNGKPSGTYDERQTRACERVQALLTELISKATEARDCVGSDRLSDLCDEMSSLVGRAHGVNDDLCADQINGY